MANRHGLESALTPIEMAKSEIVESPLSFIVPFSEDDQAWERARFFLESYLGTSGARSSAVSRVVGDSWSLLSNPSYGRYMYEVSKRAGEGGFSYVVSCRSGVDNSAQDARLNAGNFARFIREGKLEVSLLVY
jgi:hypothetical protein